jgi:O-methyltransferase
MKSTSFTSPFKYLAKKIISWAATTRLLAFPRRIVIDAITYALSSRHAVVIFYLDSERAKVIELVRKIKNEKKMLLGDNEAYQIFMAVVRTKKVDGDIAEVGVYQGASAKLICEAKGDKTLHLFDTFEGLPDLSEIDAPKSFHKGQFLAAFEDVKSYLKEYPNVQFYRGLFPSTAQPVEGKMFSFVNLDVDLYESTSSCLKFFYPRMNKGGVIMMHDYITAPGVRKAFDEFFEDKQETIIELSGTQCLIVKL